ncbi:hypothetical protein VP01_1608g2, partial [Puccinia sorghi]
GFPQLGDYLLSEPLYIPQLEIHNLNHHKMRTINETERSSFEYKSCVLAKITKTPFKGISMIASKPFEQINPNLIGPIDPQSCENHCDILTVVNNYTSYLSGFPSNENKRLRYFPPWVCSDGGGEFYNNILVVLGSKNIFRQILEPYHPKHTNSRKEVLSKGKKRVGSIIKSKNVTFLKKPELLVSETQNRYNSPNLGSLNCKDNEQCNKITKDNQFNAQKMKSINSQETVN